MCKIKVKTFEENQKIRFIVQPPMEFLFAIFNVALEDKLIEQYKELKVEFTDEISNRIHDMKKGLSRFLKNELEYFFDLDKDVFGGIGYIMFWHVAIKRADIFEIQEFIDFMQNYDSVNALSSVVRIVVQENKNTEIQDICDWENVKINPGEMIKLVENLEMDSIEYKEKILEALHNPSETKDRFCLLLKQFYEKSYKPIESTVLEELNEFKNKYQNIYAKNPEKFAKHFLKINLEKSNKINYVHVSKFSYILSNSWGRFSSDKVYNVIGAYIDKYFGEERENEKILILFKALSDKKRLDIIELLAEKDWYVYELAEELDMSAATVSYHLNMLQDLDIVQYERYEHRIYYSLDKDRLRELSQNAIKNLLHE